MTLFNRFDPVRAGPFETVLKICKLVVKKKTSTPPSAADTKTLALFFPPFCYIFWGQLHYFAQRVLIDDAIFVF